MSEPSTPRESLAEILSFRPEDGTASLESFWGASLGGDVVARAVIAATSREGESLRAAQTSFLRPARPERPLRFACEALAPDCSRVEVHDGAERCASVVLRFGPDGDGIAYQSLAAERELPAPESLPSEAETAEEEGWGAYAVGPIESRRLSVYAPVKDHEPAVWLGWLRPRVALEGDARLHAAALAFVSEYRSHWAIERRLGPAFPNTELTLLDHALWVHRPARWNDWWLVRTESEIGVGGRCLSRRTLFTREGSAVASAAWQHEVRARA